MNQVAKREDRAAPDIVRDDGRMEIWNHAKKTDPSATKDNTSGGFKSTTINGYWMIQKATELWGPVGVKWGYGIADERFDQGGPIFDAESRQVLCNSVMHTIRIEIWYPDCAKPVTQYGHTPYIYNSKYGPITDHEAPKKSLMDALKKGLSMLGFSADVFQGEFDDPEYIAELRDEEALRKADDKDAEKERQRADYRDWYQRNLDLVKTAASLSELETLFKAAYRKMNRRADQDGIKEMTLAKDARKKDLEAKKQEKAS